MVLLALDPHGADYEDVGEHHDRALRTGRVRWVVAHGPGASARLFMEVVSSPAAHLRWGQRLHRNDQRVEVRHGVEEWRVLRQHGWRHRGAAGNGGARGRRAEAGGDSEKRKDDEVLHLWTRSRFDLVP